MKLDDSDFDLFGVPMQLAQDRANLDARWKALLANAHPDRHAAAGAAAQRVAMQWAVRINEAYQRLKNPLARAAYLCRLHGAPVEAESNTAMSPKFLMQQMEWREALESASDLASVEALAAEVATRRKNLLSELEVLIDHAQDWQAASREVQALMFIERFIEDINRRIDTLED